VSAAGTVMSDISRNPGPVGSRRSRGLTFIELLVAMVVLALVVAVAIPNLSNALLGARLSAYASSLLANLQVARSEAIKRNTNVTVCASANGTTCASSGSWEQGWIVLAGTTVLRHQDALPSGYRVIQAGSLASLTFPPTVVGATAASFNVCRSSPLGKQERAVTLSATGVAYVTRTYNSSCP
jgi:type IV fimbrial biogenesis protein FimT